MVPGVSVFKKTPFWIEPEDIKCSRNHTRKELDKNKAPKKTFKESMDESRDQINEKRREVQEYKNGIVINKTA